MGTDSKFNFLIFRIWNFICAHLTAFHSDTEAANSRRPALPTAAAFGTRGTVGGDAESRGAQLQNRRESGGCAGARDARPPAQAAAVGRRGGGAAGEIGARTEAELEEQAEGRAEWRRTEGVFVFSGSPYMIQKLANWTGF